MAAKTYDYTSPWGKTYKLHFSRGTYAHGGGIAIQAWCEEEGGWLEPYANVTVNLPDARLSGKRCAFADTNDNEHLIAWMRNQNMLVETGLRMPSGYCVYPEVCFTEEFLEQCSEDD